MYNRSIKGNDGNVVSSATSQLLLYVEVEERDFADKQFTFILDVLKYNNNPGKQIRYVNRELGEFARAATESGHPHIAREASLYARKLPKSADVNVKINSRDLAMISDLENAAIQAELDRARAQSIQGLR